MQTIRRDWLMRQIDAGMVDAKCDYHLTDDYLSDVANDHGKTGWLPARMSRPYRKDPSSVNHRFLDDEERDFIRGVMNFRESDLDSTCGLAYWANAEQTMISLIVHSNLSYTLRLRTTPVEDAYRSKPLADRSQGKASTMTLERTRKRVKGKYGFSSVVEGTTMKLYGTNEATGKWFERGFPDTESARAYAAKQGWTIKGDESAAQTPAPAESKPRIRLTAIARQID